MAADMDRMECSEEISVGQDVFTCYGGEFNSIPEVRLPRQKWTSKLYVIYIIYYAYITIHYQLHHACIQHLCGHTYMYVCTSICSLRLVESVLVFTCVSAHRAMTYSSTKSPARVKWVSDTWVPICRQTS